VVSVVLVAAIPTLEALAVAVVLTDGSAGRTPPGLVAVSSDGFDALLVAVCDVLAAAADTEESGGARRSVDGAQSSIPVRATGEVMNEQRVFEAIETGEEYETDGRTVTDADMRLFAGATGATDPIHVDREYADAHPLVDDVVAQGTLLLAIADGFVVDAIAGDAALSMNYGHDEVRYLDSVSPGETVHGEVVVTETEPKDEEWGIVKAQAELVTTDGRTVLIDEHRLLVATAAHSEV
jgi:acyl dehydratase